MSQEYRDGLEAAARVLLDTAEDFEEVAARRDAQKGAHYGTRSYRAETAHIRDKAALLRGQAAHIRELAP